MEILVLGALALGLFALFNGGQSSSGGTPAQLDLKKLYADNPTAYQAVSALLGNPNPAKLNQYALQLNALYPALAKQLGDMARSLVTEVKGKSGTTWYVWEKSRNGMNRYIDVMYGSLPIITYSQEGMTGPRTYLSTYPGVDATTEKNAKGDFL